MKRLIILLLALSLSGGCSTLPLEHRQGGAEDAAAEAIGVIAIGAFFAIIILPSLIF
jgi:hypothetical protein